MIVRCWYCPEDTPGPTAGLVLAAIAVLSAASAVLMVVLVAVQR